MKYLPHSILTIAATLLIMIACSGNKEANKTHSTASAKPISFAAYDLRGTLRQSSEWVGKKPLVINLWGTWCPPCRREVPDLVKLYDEYGPRGVEMIGLAVRDTPEKVTAFADANGMKWIMMMADRGTLVNLGVTSGVPTTIFVDSSGKEVARFVGGRSYDVFKEAFESIL